MPAISWWLLFCKLYRHPHRFALTLMTYLILSPLVPWKRRDKIIEEVLGQAVDGSATRRSAVNRLSPSISWEVVNGLSFILFLLQTVGIDSQASSQRLLVMDVMAMPNKFVNHCLTNPYLSSLLLL